jgi:hypothetical protein
MAGNLTPGREVIASAQRPERGRAREGPYRVGRKVGRTIYRVVGREPSDADELIGMLDTRELAAFAVSRMNATSEAPLLAYRMKELEDVLDEVLRSFHERGHPGYSALRSGWVREDRVAEWRNVLDRRVR